MPAAWDTAQEKKLLLAIIDLTNPKPPQWPVVAEKMGGVYSSEACRQHYQKIRRVSTVASFSSASPIKKTTSKSTIRKVNKRKLSAMIVEATDDDSEREFESPYKKVKDEGETSKDLLFEIGKNGEEQAEKPISLENANELYD